MLPHLLLNHNPLAAVTQPNIFYLLYINLNLIKHAHIHTRLGQINSLIKGCYLKKPKCKPLGNSLSLFFILIYAYRMYILLEFLFREFHFLKISF
jgi:hypothetical protein